MLTTGIYEIRNLVNGNRYVGSAVNFRARWLKHQSELRRGVHHSRYLQNAWRLHGPDAFTFTPRLICSKENLVMYEQAFIDALQPEYNINPIAGSCLGKKMSAQFCEALGQRKKGVSPSAETRARISESLLGRPRVPHSAESRQKMSVAQKAIHRPHLYRLHAERIGVPRTQEVRKKLSMANARFAEEQIREIRSLFGGGMLQKDVALRFGIRQSCVSEIVRGIAYAWVS